MPATPTTSKPRGGPKTARGKASSSRNATTHGLRSLSPVLPGLEREQDWQAYRAGVFRNLAPVGEFETALAERITLLLWRLRRVARYEAATAVASTGFLAGPGSYASRPSPSFVQEHLRERRNRLDRLRRHLHLIQTLPGLDDATPLSGEEALLAVDGNPSLPGRVPLVALPLPQIPPSALPEDYQGWTVGLLRHAIDFMAARQAHTVDSFLAFMAEDARTRIEDLEEEVQQREADAAQKEREEEARVREREEQARLARLLPTADTLDRVVRYEAHLNRQLASALQQLRAWQATRRHSPPPDDTLSPLLTSPKK
jgi:hypothetical protein